MTGPILADHIKQVVREWTLNVEEPIRVYLFGSQLKGNAGPGSDIDIAVEFLNKFDDLDEWDDNREKFESIWASALSTRFDSKVHLQFYHPEYDKCLKTILQESSEIIFEPPSISD